MRPEPKKRVSTEPTAAGLQTPLADLDVALGLAGLANLPAGPEASPPAAPLTPGWKLGRVVLRRETAKRGGKTVVVISDFATHLPAPVIEDVARKVRAACGCGGTVRGRTVEIQGDQAAKVRLVLEQEGFQVAGVK